MECRHVGGLTRVGYILYVINIHSPSVHCSLYLFHHLYHRTHSAALAGMSSANAALRGVLPTDMKDLLNDKFAAVGSGDDGDHHHGHCEAIRGQTCNIPHGNHTDVIGCFQALGLSSQCTNTVALTTNSSGTWGPVCTQLNQHDLKFVEEEAIASGEGNCKVLGVDYECVGAFSAFGLKCKSSLVCVGYVAPTGAVGDAPTLGRCEAKTAANRSTGDPPGHAVQCNSFYLMNKQCDSNDQCGSVYPVGFSYPCESLCDTSTHTCVSRPSTADEEDEEEVTANAN